MKQILLTLAAATMCVTACKKQPIAVPGATAQSETNTATTFKGSKATQISIQNKKSGNGLEMDYDVIIKKVGEKKYAASMKFYGLTLNGKAVKGSNTLNIHGAQLSLKKGKDDKTVPLDVILNTPEESTITHDKVITFPIFEYAGELSFELISSATGTIIVNGDLIMSSGLPKITIADMVLTADKTTATGSSVEIKENATVQIDGKDVVTNLGISFKESDKGRCRLSDNTALFVLPSGHTATQDPQIAKITVEEKGGEYGYATITISGDPAKTISKLVYRPFAEAGKTYTGPEMTFVPTHYNMVNGIQRFESTKKWSEVFGGTSVTPEMLIRRGREMGLPSFTDVR
jgi:hypothetical protein